jgi:hypothetical protein
MGASPDPTAAQLAACGPFWQPRTGPDAWAPSQAAHLIFDRLSGVDAANRQRGDRIPKMHLEALQKWLDGSDADSIVQWTHTFLAHAADRVRRGRVNPNAI